MSIRYGSLAGLATAALVLSAVATSGEELERKGIPAPPGHVFQTIISGYQFRTKETRALQDDDLENPWSGRPMSGRRSTAAKASRA